MFSRAAIPWVAPFGVFILLLAGLKSLAIPQPWEALLWIVILVAVMWTTSRDVIDLRPRHALASIGLGLAVFALWIAPDALVPGWREHWLFSNDIVGRPTVSLDDAARRDTLTLLLRAARAVLLVPILEELFWRGWLPRVIADSDDFERVPLGRYTPLAFWATAILFASEHGSYWEVGLLCGMIYNWWMIRTKSIADLILTHAVTNGALSAYVVLTGEWQYWM
ncbi:MAG: CAAX prenyl protease-related protein [Gemmatimonadaceae bacterium]|nr:CAAX prenyl protease-related protein [Gemmatimonadaceae bacterium]